MFYLSKICVNKCSNKYKKRNAAQRSSNINNVPIIMVKRVNLKH